MADPTFEKMLIVTTESMPGYEIEKVCGTAWAIAAHSQTFFKDFLAAFRLMRGGEIREYSDMLRKTRLDAMHRLAENTRKLGGNAVVGVRFSTEMIAPGAVEVMVYGTAVKIKRKGKASKGHKK